MYVDGINLFVKNEKEVDTFIQTVKGILSGYRDGICL